MQLLREVSQIFCVAVVESLSVVVYAAVVGACLALLCRALGLMFCRAPVNDSICGFQSVGRNPTCGRESILFSAPFPRPKTL
jgi:hypothetical protein